MEGTRSTLSQVEQALLNLTLYNNARKLGDSSLRHCSSQDLKHLISQKIEEKGYRIVGPLMEGYALQLKYKLDRNLKVASRKLLELAADHQRSIVKRKNNMQKK